MRSQLGFFLIAVFAAAAWMTSAPAQTHYYRPYSPPPEPRPLLIPKQVFKQADDKAARGDSNAPLESPFTIAGRVPAIPTSSTRQPSANPGAAPEAKQTETAAAPPASQAEKWTTAKLARLRPQYSTTERTFNQNLLSFTNRLGFSLGWSRPMAATNVVEYRIIMD